MIELTLGECALLSVILTIAWFIKDLIIGLVWYAWTEIKNYFYH